MKSKASIHIDEDENGQIEVYCELDPELTDAQRVGEEDLSFSQYMAGMLVEAVGQALDRFGMERLEHPDAEDAHLKVRVESEDSDTTLH